MSFNEMLDINNYLSSNEVQQPLSASKDNDQLEVQSLMNDLTNLRNTQ